MNAAEMRGKTQAELKKLVTELRREQFNLRMQKGTGQLTKPARVKAIRRDIARIKTLLQEMATGKSV